VTTGGWAIIIAQRQSALRSVPNLDESSAHRRPSSGITFQGSVPAALAANRRHG
jgi:hypothetical protein